MPDAPCEARCSLVLFVIRKDTPIESSLHQLVARHRMPRLRRYQSVFLQFCKKLLQIAKI